MKRYTFDIPETPEAKVLLHLIISSGYFKEIHNTEIEVNIPNDETIEAINAIERGEVNKYENASSMFNHLKDSVQKA